VSVVLEDVHCVRAACIHVTGIGGNALYFRVVQVARVTNAQLGAVVSFENFTDGNNNEVLPAPLMKLRHMAERGRMYSESLKSFEDLAPKHGSSRNI